MKIWLEDIVAELQEVQSPRRQFINSVCIVYCTVSCNIGLLKKKEFVYPLLKMLRLNPDVNRRVCPNFSSLYDLITPMYW